MKRLFIIPLLLVAVVAPQSDAKSYKRGVGENQFSCRGQMAPLAPGVSWFYTWGQTPSKGYENQVIDFEDMEFVSMSWNNLNASALREYAASHPNLKYLLGYNEPNFKNQANLTPEQAAERWPDLQAIAAELGLKLVAPALNYSPDAPYQNPVTWMDQFVQLVGKDAFDFTAIHNYGGLSVMKTLAGEFHDRYGKPVWVTEFCNWPGGAGNVYVSPEAQMASMIETVEWLETTDWIYRYAWFKPIGDVNSQNRPNYGLELSALGLDERELSDLGWVYVYMSEFDKNLYNEVNSVVAATDYIASNGLKLGKGGLESSPRPIEIKQIAYGAYADYQFDVPAAGEYNLNLTVSGYGEPTRFDPNLAVMLVDENGTETELAAPGRFALPNSDSEYAVKSIALNLNAGKQCIRIKDIGGVQASGIRISTVSLTDRSAVETLGAASSAEVEYFNLQGVKVSQPTNGIYICRRGSNVSKAIIR